MKSILQRVFAHNSEKASQQLTAWLTDLADLDDIPALKLSTQHLALLVDEEKLPINQKLDLILELEELNRHRLDKLSTEFSSLSNIQPELEASIAETCYAYCRQSYIFHLKTIELVINPLSFKLEEEGQLLLLARAVNAAINMVKWRQFGQQNAPAKVWLQIYLLYKIAHQQNLLNTPIELFPLSPATTLSAYIVQVCMLGQLKNANLDKQHIETAVKVIRTLITHAHISNQYNAEQYLFYINLEQDLPAKRIRKIEPTALYRYWELDDLEKQMTVAINVSGRGEFPDSLILSKIDDADILHETLMVLHEEWTKKDYVRQRRSEVREATSKNAKVKAGVLNICDQVLHANQINKGLKQSRKSASLDGLLSSHAALNQSSGITVNSGSLDTWIITDQSKHGLGARVNKYANTLARPKKLIGLVFDDDPAAVSIGVIKTVKATQGNQLRVGIAIISNFAIWCQLQPFQENNSFTKKVLNVNNNQDQTANYTNASPGIYLPEEPGLTKQAAMIIPKINFKLNTVYTVHLNGKTKRVEFDDELESNDDWVKVAIDF